jgi:pimeloyl-ACP methyl ester carboxylesterase
MTNDLVLLPGIVCDHAVWEPILPALPPSVRCHVPDYGMAGSITAMAHGVLRQAPATFSLAAHSMGTRVAFEVVRMAPERVQRLALLAAAHKGLAAGPAGETEAAKRHRLLAIARREGMRAMAQEWVRGMVHPDRLTDANLIGNIISMIERKTPEIFAAQIRALLARPDAGPVVAALPVPLWLIAARQDTWSPLSQQEDIAGLAPSAQLRIIEQCGHMSPMEQPAQVASALREWLASDLERQEST